MELAPHAFSLRQLQYLVAVAETLSFRGAARRCHVSQPALSAQLAQLEAALGVRLFERDRRRVLVTATGRELVARAQRLLVEADDLLAAARRAGDPLAGTLTLGVIPTVSPYLLPVVSPALRSAYPGLSILWKEERTAVLVRSLDAGRIDAALLALEADLGDVESEVIARDTFVLAAPAGHPLGERAAAATPAELRDVDVLLLDDGHCLRDQALAVCSRARAHELEFRATSLTTLAQMVAGGAGVTLLPRLAVPTEARLSGLRVRPFAEPAPHRTIALVWRRRSPLTPALRQLAQTLREAFPAPVGSGPAAPTSPARRPARTASSGRARGG